jgi:hypothetical protein
MTTTTPATLADLVYTARTAYERTQHCLADAQDTLARVQRARTQWGVDAALQDGRAALAACRAAEATLADCARRVEPMVATTVAEADDRAWVLCAALASDVPQVRALLARAEELAAQRWLEGSAIPVPGHGA